MAGAYYTTTFVSPRMLGYENTTGPQLFPVISRSLENGGSWSAYFKYSPVSQKLSFLTLSNAELGAGATYQFFSFGKTPISFTLDLAKLSLNTGATGTIHSTSVTVGGAVGF